MGASVLKTTGISAELGIVDNMNLLSQPHQQQSRHSCTNLLNISRANIEMELCVSQLNMTASREDMEQAGRSASTLRN
eukprot:12915087-Prorocentrum_lima.AAC.1